jgi:hypothetical protein
MSGMRLATQGATQFCMPLHWPARAQRSKKNRSAGSGFWKRNTRIDHPTNAFSTT